MTDARVAQEALEVAASGSAIQAAQVALEAVTSTAQASSLAAQVALEAVTYPAARDSRVAQLGFEVLVRSFELPGHTGWGIPA